MNKLNFALIIFFTLFSFSSHVLAIKDPIVAEGPGVKITRSELEKAYRQNLLFVSNRPVTLRSVLNHLINRKLGIQAAKREGLQNNPAVKSKMEDVLYNAKISKDLEKDLNKIKVTQRDVKNYYKSYPEYRTAHILFRVQANPTAEEIAAAQEMAIKVYRQVSKNPKKFSELADKYSQSSTAPSGGDMGFQPAIRMAPEYFKAIKGKIKGHISPPVRTQFGYHIVKVLAIKDYKKIAQPLYKKIVYDTKRDKIIDNYFKNLRKKSKIKINKQYLKKIPIDLSKIKKN